MDISQFLNFYIGNLSVLSEELHQSQRSLQLLNQNKQSLTLDVQQKFQRFVGDMMKKPTLNHDDDDAIRDSQIKMIYFQIRQIQKFEVEKRTLTREACSILDKYLALLGRKVKSTQEKLVNAEDRSQELAETLASIQLQLDQPVQGGAAIIDMIKKMEDRTTATDQSDHLVDEMIFDDKNINLFTTVSKCATLTLDDMLGSETKDISSDMIRQPDSLQSFTEKIIGICTDIKKRRGPGEASNTQAEASTNDDNNETDEDYFELCHCRTQEFRQMVACDNTRCKIMWYHFDCVGVVGARRSSEDPFLCPTCTILGSEAKKDSSKDSSNDSPKDSSNDSPKDSSNDSSNDSPKDSSNDSPKDSSNDSPEDSPKDSPKDSSNDSPKDSS